MKRLLVVIALCLMLVIVLPSQISEADGVTVTWTSTSDFDSGTKTEGTVQRNFFATNGVSQPNNFINYPSAAYSGGRTYAVFQGSADGGASTPDPYITYYDHAAGTWATPVKIADSPLTNDDHGAPAILVSAGYIHVFYGSHATAQRYARSTLPQDISSWTLLGNPAPDLVTYPKPILVGSTIYLFLREGNVPGTYSWQTYTTSTDNGASWSALTTIIDFGSGGMYTGPIVLGGASNDRVFMEWTWDSGGRQSAYVGYLNTADGKMYCKGDPSDIDLGTTIDQTEANASCRIETTAGGDANFGAIRLDSSSNPYIIYSRAWSGASWNYRFSRWTGTAWSAPANITTSKHQENHCDFLVASSSSITALCTRSGLVATGRGGNIEKWTWDGAIWTNAGTTLDERLALASLNNPQLVFNRDPSLQFVFTEVRTDSYSSADDDSLSLYAHSGTAFVTRADAAGTYGLESTTDDPQVPSGALEIASGKGDAFTLSDADGFTTRWHPGRYRSGSDQKGDIVDISTTVSGSLYLEMTTGTGSADAFGLVSEFTITGDFDMNLAPSRIAADSGVRLKLAILNEDVVSPDASTTVDGLEYEQFWQTGTDGDRRFIAYTVTNGVRTTIGTSTQFTGASSFDRQMRVSRVGSTITWYYNATGSETWTQDETTSFTLSGDLRTSIHTNAASLRTTKWSVSRFQLTAVTFAANGYRASGYWTSSLQETGNVPRRVTVTYSGVTATYPISAIEILDVAGRTIATTYSPITAGTTFIWSVPISDEEPFQIWSLRVTLEGDGAGSGDIEQLEVDAEPVSEPPPGRVLSIVVGCSYNPFFLTWSCVDRTDYMGFIPENFDRMVWLYDGVEVASVIDRGGSVSFRAPRTTWLETESTHLLEVTWNLRNGGTPTSAFILRVDNRPAQIGLTLFGLGLLAVIVAAIIRARSGATAWEQVHNPSYRRTAIAIEEYPKGWRSYRQRPHNPNLPTTSRRQGDLWIVYQIRPATAAEQARTGRKRIAYVQTVREKM